MINSIDRIGFLSIKSSLYYIQKIALSALVLLFFKSLGERQPIWLNPIAKTAFTIYFVHTFFLSIGIGLLIPFIQNQKIAPFNVIGGGLLLLLLSIAMSIGFAWIFRKLFGKYSRMIVGS